MNARPPGGQGRAVAAPGVARVCGPRATLQNCATDWIPPWLRDLRRALDEEPDDNAPAWKPNVGDEIVGRVVLRDQIANKYKPDTPTERVVVHAEDGQHRTIYGNHTVLRNKVQNLDPQVGDRIAIRRLADDPDKGYARYKVVVERVADQVMPPDSDDPIRF